MPLVDDVSAFFRTDEFAVSALLDGAPAVGLFDNAYQTVLGGMATMGPAFSLPTAAAGAAAQGSTLVVEGATYRVRNVEPDGNGVTILPLELQ